MQNRAEKADSMNVEQSVTHGHHKPTLPEENQFSIPSH
jgi:hypothetical protein